MTGARRLTRDRGEEGQAMVFAILVVLLLMLIGTSMVISVNQEQPVATYSLNEHGAYAAMQAGIQQYRALLDADQNYASYTWPSNLNSSDPAMKTGSWQAVNGVGQTSSTPQPGPREYFHYVPYTGFINSTTGSVFSKGHILLTVTGRAGNPYTGRYAYATETVAFVRYASYLNDGYYSNYEVLDVKYPGGQSNINVTEAETVNGVTTTQSVPEDSVTLSYSYKNNGGTLVTVPSTTLQQALCQYTQYQQNTFVDSWSDTADNPQFISTNMGTDVLASPTGAFSTSNPYYGAFYGVPTTVNTGSGTAGTPTLNASAGWAQPSGGLTLKMYPDYPSTSNVTQYTFSSAPCSNPFEWTTGESFSGPVYSTDELHVCGSPAFNGAPYGLITAAPSNFAFRYQWPGATKQTVAGVTSWVPLGYTLDQVGCSTTKPTPTIPNGIQLGGNEALPQFDDALQSYTTGAAGTSGDPNEYKGCLFTGPTMIELVTDTSTNLTTMDVWSPLSRSTDGCGTFAPGTSSSPPAACAGEYTPSDATGAWQTGIALPPNGVVYVQNVPASSTDANYWSPSCVGALTNALVNPSNDVSTTATCFLNPYLAQIATYMPTNQVGQVALSSPQCTEGDLVVEGELSGELTIGADASIMISRPISYACADTGGTLHPAGRSGLPTACNSATVATQNPDLLGLYTNGQVIAARPVTAGSTGPKFPGTNTAGGCASSYCDLGYCTYSGVGTPPNAGNAINASTPPTADVAPTCDNYNTVIDALLISLNGSFDDQNYDLGAYDSNMNLNGTDVANERGPFGTTGCGSFCSGMAKTFTYDTRLAYLAPPDAVTASVNNWYAIGNASCGGINTVNWGGSVGETCPQSK